MKDHPQEQALQYFIEHPDSDAADIALHLAQCGDCRGKFQAMEMLMHHGEWIGATDQVEEASIKSRLHALADAYEMEQDMGADVKAGVSISAPGAGLWRNFIAALAELRNYFPLPVTAVTLVALLMVLVPLLLSQKQPRLIAYQDNPVVQYTDENPLPGIGFFAAQKPESVPFDAMVVELEGHQVMLHWPELTRAVSYNLSVYSISQGERRLIAQQQSIKPEASIVLNDKPGGHYTWLLTGKTDAGKRFKAEGGFVISQ